jgi:hypothetical protein
VPGAVEINRERSNCPICHVLPAPDAALHGDMGPSLRGLATDSAKARSGCVWSMAAASTRNRHARLLSGEQTEAGGGGLCEQRVLSVQEIED